MSLPSFVPARFLSAALAAASVLVNPACAKAETDYGEVAMAVVTAMQNQHYSRHDFDDVYSKRMLEHFLDLLDFDHRFFLQSDIDQFRKDYATQLDDMIVVNADVSAGHKIYAVFSQRVKDRAAKIQSILKNEKFAFDGQDVVDISRKKLPWPKSEAEADDLWLRILKNQVLAERLNRTLKAEREAEKARETQTRGAREGRRERNPRPQPKPPRRKPRSSGTASSRASAKMTRRKSSTSSSRRSPPRMTRIPST